MADDKGLLDYISDWFKILLKSGLPAFLIGLGWLSVFLGGLWLSSSGTTFWVEAGVGIMMIVMGFYLHIWEEKRES